MGMNKAQDLPDDWRLLNLSDVVFFQEGPGVRKHQFTKNGIKLLNVRNLVDNQLRLNNTETCISKDEATTKYNHFLVEEGDLIIASSGIKVDYFHKKIAFVKKEHLPLCMNTSTIRFRTLDENILDIQYFRYFLMTRFFSRQVNFHITGSAQLNFGPSHLKKMKVIIPPLPTQKKIVVILEKAEKLKGWRREADELTDELLKSTFLEMFYKNNPDYFNWEFVAIKDLTSQEKGSLRTGPFGSDLKHSEFVDSGIAVLGIDNVVNNRFQWGQRRYITKEKYDGLKRYTVHPNDILISIMATIGKSCVVPDDIPLSISTKHLAVITSDRTKCDPQFLSHSILFHPEIKQQLTKANIGAIMDGLNLKIIKSLKIPLPPLSLQHKFTEILKNVESVRQNQNQSQQKINNLFNALMQQAFRGELS